MIEQYFESSCLRLVDSKRLDAERIEVQNVYILWICNKIKTRMSVYSLNMYLRYVCNWKMIFITLQIVATKHSITKGEERASIYYSPYCFLAFFPNFSTTSIIPWKSCTYQHAFSLTASLTVTPPNPMKASAGGLACASVAPSPTMTTVS